MLALIYASLLAACSHEPAPVPDTKETSTEDKAVYWELVGTVGPKKSRFPSPPPFEGGQALVERCKERRPCSAERWRSTSSEIMDMVLIERTFYFADGRPPWPAQWMDINGVLRACVGDPLSIPPTDDPEAVRTLVTRATDAEWWLYFSGNNTCGLEGQLRLNAMKSSVDTSALRCEGKRWREGGRECAREKMVRAKTK